MTKLKSIADYPIKIEKSSSDTGVISVQDLEEQIEQARKGKAKVDSKYVGNADRMKHIFEYSFNYPRFLENIVHIIKEKKNA